MDWDPQIGGAAASVGDHPAAGVAEYLGGKITSKSPLN